MQLREITDYCGRRGWSNPLTFVDRASSGKVRPELERLKTLCRQRKIDMVVVYRFDRFARSTRELVEAVEEFATLGIQFISLHENVDTTCPQGKLVFTIFAAVAEFERELIKERVRSGDRGSQGQREAGWPPRRRCHVDFQSQGNGCQRPLPALGRKVAWPFGRHSTQICR